MYPNPVDVALTVYISLCITGERSSISITPPLMIRLKREFKCQLIFDESEFILDV
jgi:hypothetical protein